ncbi:MAG: Single-stranded DNA-binding protein [Dehalococcoidia bacterium]|nr:Single-stranded DNA-binding protein [Chloroflexota bacterium]
MANTVAIMGTLGRNPEIRYFGSDSVICEIAIASNRKVKGQDITDWWQCKAWGKTAEVIAEYFKKGQRIVVYGALKQEHWIDKDTGKDRNKPVIRVNTFDFVERRDSLAPTEEMLPPATAQVAADLSDIPF